MSNDKAPLPDEVEAKLRKLCDLAGRAYEPLGMSVEEFHSYLACTSDLRAHIASQDATIGAISTALAAQAEKIAKLEHDAGEKQREVNKWQAKYWALEAENKRLREAVEIGVAYITAAQTGLAFTQLRMKADMAIMEAALAQEAK